MKKILYILALLTATQLAAQQYAPQDQIEDCWKISQEKDYPYYYCDCWYASSPFAFPMERVITDTTWFTATFDDIKKGISANWYSDDSVTIELYAFCSSKTPSFTLTVGPNQMREMDADKINKKLEEAGADVQTMAQLLKPHFRIYPHNKGKGTVYCYPYDQGPHSTCDKTLPVFNRMTNVCSAADNVYMLPPSRMSTYGRGFIVWKQKKDLPGTIYITKDSCNGPEIGRSVLTDSLHVMILDSVAVKAAKKAKDTLYIHVEHPEDYVGRMIYHNTIKWSKQVIDTTFCQGKRLILHDTILTKTTVYTKDTLWTKGDTLACTTYKVTVTPPDTQHTKLSIYASQLPYKYKSGGKIVLVIKNEEGWDNKDYYWSVHNTDKCDQVGYVHVTRKFDKEHITIDTTVCQGKGFAFGEHIYYTDTTVVDSAWLTMDLWAVDTIKLKIQAPETEYDTVTVAPSTMQAGYIYQPYNITITAFGDTLLLATQQNECDRKILLTVLQGTDPTTWAEYLTNNQHAAGKYLRNGMIVIRRNDEEYDILGNKIN